MVKLMDNTNMVDLNNLSKEELRKFITRLDNLKYEASKAVRTLAKKERAKEILESSEAPEVLKQLMKKFSVESIEIVNDKQYYENYMDSTIAFIFYNGYGEAFTFAVLETPDYTNSSNVSARYFTELESLIDFFDGEYDLSDIKLKEEKALIKYLQTVFFNTSSTEITRTETN